MSWRFLLILLFLFVANANAEESLTRLKSEVSAPDFNLVDMDGKHHRLSDYRGKVLVVNFWATWCPPCREEMPSMNRAWKKIKNENIIFIGINVGETEDTIFEFFADYPVDFLVLLDITGDVIEQWPVKGLPTTFVINPEGKFVYRAIGAREWDNDKLLDKVRILQ